MKKCIIIICTAVACLSGCGFMTDEVTDAKQRGASSGLADRSLRPRCPRVIPEWSPFTRETPATLEAYRASYLKVCIKS